MTKRIRKPRPTKKYPYRGTEAGVIIDWIEAHCRLPEGPRVGDTVRLRLWQQDEIAKIYNNAVGTRRAIISFARKNAKTALAAFLLLVHLCGPRAKPNSNLYSAAQSRDQAAVVFTLAAKIVRLSPTLSTCVAIRDTAKQLACPEIGTLYRALSAEVATAYGLNPSLIIHDELGQVRGPRSALYDALETATGAQEDALSIIISTQAPTDNDLLSVLIDDALAENDPHVVLSLYTAPEEDDPFAEATIRKANPAFGDFLVAKEVMSMADDARRMPSRESEFRNLVLNQRVEASTPLFGKALWMSCGSPVSPLSQATVVYGGLDLSTTSDLTSLVLIGLIDGKWHVHPTFWLPGEGLATKSRVDRVPYDVWAREGYLTTAPGRSIEYEYVALWLKEVVDKFKIAKIAFDRWNFKHLKPWLLKAGFTDKQVEEKFVEFGQGFASMSPALREFESDILNSKIVHGNNPVLNMCAENAVVQSDPAGNRKLAKHKSVGRIDGMIALTMARGIATVSVIRKYQMFTV